MRGGTSLANSPCEQRELRARVGTPTPGRATLDVLAPSEPITLGRYLITRRIGAGGMGVVYEAQDRRHGQRVALKTLDRVDPSGLYRLKQEFRAVADIAHPNLVTLYELVSEDGTWFFTMEFVEGVNFLDYVALRPPAESGPAGPRSVAPPSAAAACAVTLPSGPLQAVMANVRRACSNVPRVPHVPHLPHLPPAPAPTKQPPPTLVPPGPVASLERLRPVLAQLARAVDALHRAGKLHRDIKPANLLVTREGRLVVLDFGLASDTGEREELDREGTPGYMAPEQAAGGGATPASDWYAVGGVLYQALTGRLPFNGTAYEVLSAKMQREPPPPSAVAPGIPPDLDVLCTALLRRLPEDRPSGAEIVRALESASGRTGAPRVRTWPPPRRAQADAPPSRRALHGRDAALEALVAAHAAVAPGAPVTVLVRGDSGMGKTALVQHFLQLVRRSTIPRDPSSRAAATEPPPAPTSVNDPQGDSPRTVRAPRMAPSSRANSAWTRRRGAPTDPPSAAPTTTPAAPRAVVLSGRCDARELVPYKAFDGLIDALSRQLRALPDRTCAAILPADVADLARLFPVLERVPAVAAAALRARPRGDAADAADADGAGGVDSAIGLRTAAPDEQLRRAAGALKDVLRSIAARVPLVLVLDDLQWGDRESAELLREITSGPDAPGVLIVAVYRSGGAERSPFLRELSSASPRELRLVEVGPLSWEEARMLALSRLAASGAAVGVEACADRIASEAEGSPLLLEELVRYARERSPRPEQGGAPPAPTLAEVLTARLAALPSDARRLLELVAAAGGPLPRRAALDVAELGAGAARALHLLCVAGLLRIEGGTEEALIDTTHARIRERALADTALPALASYRRALSRALGRD